MDERVMPVLGPMGIVTPDDDRRRTSNTGFVPEDTDEPTFAVSCNGSVVYPGDDDRVIVVATFIKVVTVGE